MVPAEYGLGGTSGIAEFKSVGIEISRIEICRTEISRIEISRTVISRTVISRTVISRTEISRTEISRTEIWFRRNMVWVERAELLGFGGQLGDGSKHPSLQTLVNGGVSMQRLVERVDI